MALTKKNIKIIDEWVRNEVDESELIEKYRISYKKLSKLLNYKQTKEEIEGRVEAAKKRSQLLLSKYLPLAMAKLIEQCNSENSETSRKACMDILAIPHGKETSEKPEEKTKEPKLDYETATKVWAVLAESRKKRP
jgi:hypothetical protein